MSKETYFIDWVIWIWWITVWIHTERLQHHIVFAQEIPSSSVHIDNGLARRCVRFTDCQWIQSRWIDSRLLGYDVTFWHWWLRGGYKANCRYGSIHWTSFAPNQRHLHFWHASHFGDCDGLTWFWHSSVVRQNVLKWLEFEYASISVGVSSVLNSLKIELFAFFGIFACKATLTIDNKMLCIRFSVHICVTLMHTMDGMADKFIKDVKTEVDEIMKNPGKPVEGKVCIGGSKLISIWFYFDSFDFIEKFLLNFGVSSRWLCMAKPKRSPIVHW